MGGRSSRSCNWTDAVVAPGSRRARIYSAPCMILFTSPNSTLPFAKWCGRLRATRWRRWPHATTPRRIFRGTTSRRWVRLDCSASPGPSRSAARDSTRPRSLSRLKNLPASTLRTRSPFLPTPLLARRRLCGSARTRSASDLFRCWRLARCWVGLDLPRIQPEAMPVVRGQLPSSRGATIC